MSDKIVAPKWYIIIAIGLLVWNLIGVSAYLGQVYMSDESFALQSQELQNAMNNTPIWATAAFSLAVFAGSIASILLIIKKKLAYLLFLFSLVAAIVQNVHNLLLSDNVEILGNDAIVMPMIVIIVCVFQVWFAKYSVKKKWIV